MSLRATRGTDEELDLDEFQFRWLENGLIDVQPSTLNFVLSDLQLVF